MRISRLSNFVKTNDRSLVQATGLTYLYLAKRPDFHDPYIAMINHGRFKMQLKRPNDNDKLNDTWPQSCPEFKWSFWCICTILHILHIYKIRINMKQISPTVRHNLLTNIILIVDKLL